MTDMIRSADEAFVKAMREFLTERIEYLRGSIEWAEKRGGEDEIIVKTELSTFESVLSAFEAAAGAKEE